MRRGKSGAPIEGVVVIGQEPGRFDTVEAGGLLPQWHARSTRVPGALPALQGKSGGALPRACGGKP
jgi:hypothetical protein